MKEISIINNVLDNEINHLQILKNSFKNEEFYKNFSAALNLIGTCQGKILVSGIGKSGLIGTKISAIFSSIGIPSFFIHPVEAIHGDLGCICKEDVLIALSNSGNTKEMFDIINYCKNNNIKIIAITSGKKSFLTDNCDASIIFDMKEEAINGFPIPTTSSIITLAICDALTACLVDKKKLTYQQYGQYHCGGKIGEKMKELTKK